MIYFIILNINTFAHSGVMFLHSQSLENAHVDVRFSSTKFGLNFCFFFFHIYVGHHISSMSATMTAICPPLYRPPRPPHCRLPCLSLCQPLCPPPYWSPCPAPCTSPSPPLVFSPPEHLNFPSTKPMTATKSTSMSATLSTSMSVITPCHLNAL